MPKAIGKRSKHQSHLYTAHGWNTSSEATFELPENTQLHLENRRNRADTSETVSLIYR